jgi:AcrR family transcriptional regulator
VEAHRVKTRITSSNARGSALTREATLLAALEIIDEDGIEGLSMRRLGRALGRDPMSLYRHATTKAELLAGVADLVLSDLSVDTADGDWPAQLRAFAHQFRELALAHPNVIPLLVTRPLATPIALRPLGTLRPLEAILELLIHAGFSPVDALHVYRSFYGFIQGHVLNELQEIVENAEETDDLLRLGLHRLPLRDFPRLRSLASVLAAYDGATEMERGLDMLLAGLQAQLHPLSTSRE